MVIWGELRLLFASDVVTFASDQGWAILAVVLPQYPGNTPELRNHVGSLR